MKFPNERQAVLFGNINIAKSAHSEYSDGMKRDAVSQIIAQNLTRILADRGMSALALGEKVGMGRSSVYDILTGRSLSPKVSTVAKLAEGLGVPLSDMFLTQEQIEAQSEMLKAYNRLPEDEQRRLANVARAWKLD